MLGLYFLLIAVSILLPAGIYAWFTDINFRRKFRPKFLIKSTTATILKKGELESKLNFQSSFVTIQKSMSSRYNKKAEMVRNLIFDINGEQILLVVDKTTYVLSKKGDYGKLLYKGKDFYSFTKLDKPKDQEKDMFEEYYS